MMKNKNNSLLRLTYTGVFAAMICLTTAFILHIPVGNGYIHLGDSMIYLAACMLPAPYGLIAAALGGGLADLLCGYTAYVLPTMLIKTALAGCFYLLKAGQNGRSICGARSMMATAVCVPVTVIGYWLTGVLLYGGCAAQLIATVPMNFVQAIGSAAAFYLLAFSCERVKTALPRFRS